MTNGEKLHIRVRGENDDNQGEYSIDYPVYISENVPPAPQGLKAWRCQASYKIIWGSCLGVEKYRLYKKIKGSEGLEIIFEGYENEFIDTQSDRDGRIYEYFVTAVNGNGESAKSAVRNTAPEGLAFWDPRPSEEFRRYTKSHEYGYNGFDFPKNFNATELSYPK